jgi:hypothetical protein
MHSFAILIATCIFLSAFVSSAAQENQAATSSGRSPNQSTGDSPAKLYVFDDSGRTLRKPEIALTVEAGRTYYVVIAYSPSRSWAAPVDRQSF